MIVCELSDASDQDGEMSTSWLFAVVGVVADKSKIDRSVFSY